MVSGHRCGCETRPVLGDLIRSRETGVSLPDGFASTDARVVQADGVDLWYGVRLQRRLGPVKLDRGHR